MSKSTNSLAVGAFVTGAFLILIVMLFSISGDLFKRNLQSGLVVFDGTLKGLNVGAPVAFKGVKIGEVVDYGVYVDSETYDVVTPVELRIDKDRIRRTDDNRPSEDDLAVMIDRGLRAQLQLQSLLTGLLYIELDFHPGSAKRYDSEHMSRYDIDEDWIVIPTIPKELEQISRTLEEVDLAAMLKKVDETLTGINSFVNEPATQALPEGLVSALASIEQLSSRLDTQLEALSPDLDALVANSADTMKTLNNEMPALTSGARESLEELASTLAAANRALEEIEYSLSDESAVIYDVREAAQELTRAGRALQALAETLETQPEALIKGKGAAK